MTEKEKQWLAETERNSAWVPRLKDWLLLLLAIGIGLLPVALIFFNTK
jgi:hypothetical protein